jgi:hypothetical protein
MWDNYFKSLEDMWSYKIFQERQSITTIKKLLIFGKTFTTMSFQTLKEKTNVVWED